MFAGREFHAAFRSDPASPLNLPAGVDHRQHPPRSVRLDLTGAHRGEQLRHPPRQRSPVIDAPFDLAGRDPQHRRQLFGQPPIITHRRRDIGQHCQLPSVELCPLDTGLP
ncbi:hypothetical protein GCM10009676_34930 [Prauserella halophila]|uniref:Uncharacterized protein n=1 Tax=Prauserella halophila TaxID=185641 RepID=A0ABN1WCP7_9PSEU